MELGYIPCMLTPGPRMHHLARLLIAPLLVCACALAQADGSADGRVIDFLIEEGSISQPQTAMVQDGRVLVRQAGGDPAADLLFDAASNTLYFIDHPTRSFHQIDESVVNKAISMLESLSSVAESQQGVLADLLGTLGLSGDEKESIISIRETDTLLSAGDIPCRLFQQFRDERLETELCIAAPEALSALGPEYQTMQAFYDFGDLLLSRAATILNNMGMAMPAFRRMGDSGLPVLAYVARSKTKVSLAGIGEQQWPTEMFDLPAGYSRTPIPFLEQ